MMGYVRCAGSRDEARNSAATFLEDVSEKQVEVLGARDWYFPSRVPKSRSIPKV
jgi:hypothetical protein